MGLSGTCRIGLRGSALKGSVETLRGPRGAGRGLKLRFAGVGRLIAGIRPLPATPPMGGNVGAMPMGARGRVGENGGARAVPLPPAPSAPLTSSSEEACGDFLTVGQPLLGPFPLFSSGIIPRPPVGEARGCSRRGNMAPGISPDLGASALSPRATAAW
jgi:hypothetical protein